MPNRFFTSKYSPVSKHGCRSVPESWPRRHRRECVLYNCLHVAKEKIVIDYYQTLPDRPVVSTESPGYLRRLIPPTVPHDGEPWDQIQRDIERVVMPGLTHWQHPNFMAFFPANTS